jgi:hypothetical protein
MQNTGFAKQNCETIVPAQSFVQPTEASRESAELESSSQIS